MAVFLRSFQLLVTLAITSATCNHCLHGSCDSSEQCTYGCVAGYADKDCKHACPKTCKNFECKVNAYTGSTVCLLKCEDGYCGTGCKIPCQDNCLRCDQGTCLTCSQCRDERYGDVCQRSCMDKCSGFACTIKGNCMETCTDGRYGENCTSLCHYKYKSCKQNTGECISCRHGFYGNSCENECPFCLNIQQYSDLKSTPGCQICITEDNNNPEVTTLKRELQLYSVATYSLTALLIVVVMFVVGVKVCKRRRKKLNQWIVQEDRTCLNDDKGKDDQDSWTAHTDSISQASSP